MDPVAQYFVAASLWGVLAHFDRKFAWWVVVSGGTFAAIRLVAAVVSIG
jgi:hypothetical protein